MLGLAMVPPMAGLSAYAVSRPARALPPALATVLLTAFAATVSGITAALLLMAAYLGTVTTFPAIHPHDWSVSYLHRVCPIPPAVGLGLGLVALVMLARAGAHAARVAASARRTSALAAGLPLVEGISAVDDPSVQAWAVPGRSARIVVTTGLLRTLDGPGRRALLAHERAHLRHRHHVYVQLARLAAAANPLLRPVSRAVDGAVERWADACAVREVGSERVVARAVGAAALGSSGPALAASGGDVVERVRELLEPTVRRPVVGVRLGLMTLACWASGAAVLLWAHRMVELAEVSYRAAR